jgi:hypothetical protein
MGIKCSVIHNYIVMHYLFNQQHYLSSTQEYILRHIVLLLALFNESIYLSMIYSTWIYLKQ